jgi:predicted secreted protein
MITQVFHDGKAVPGCFQIGGQEPGAAPKLDDQEWKLAQPLVVSAPATAQAPKPTKPRTARTLVAELRTRLREVEREIRARKNLEDERDSLKRLIAAAKSETNNVRRIRAAG